MNITGAVRESVLNATKQPVRLFHSFAGDQFLHRLTEQHDVSDTEFLTDAGGYLTALARLDLRGGLNYIERNSIEKWFQTVMMRINCRVESGYGVGVGSLEG